MTLGTTITRAVPCARCWVMPKKMPSSGMMKSPPPMPTMPLSTPMPAPRSTSSAISAGEMIISGRRSARRASVPGAGPPASLVLELHRLDDHSPVHALHHVVDGQRGRRGSGERLHLHPGSVERLHLGTDQGAALVERDLHRHPGEGDGMAERNQIRRALGGHHPGEPGGGEHVALLHLALADTGHGLWLHPQPGRGHRHALGALLAADVHHLHDRATVWSAWRMSSAMSSGSSSPTETRMRFSPMPAAARSSMLRRRALALAACMTRVVTSPSEGAGRHS